VIALGSELETLVDRLARRRGNVTLAQFRLLDALASADPEPLEPLDLARMLHLGSNHVTMLLDSLEDRILGEALDPAERAHLRTLPARVRRVIAGV